MLAQLLARVLMLRLQHQLLLPEWRTRAAMPLLMVYRPRKNRGMLIPKCCASERRREGRLRKNSGRKPLQLPPRNGDRRSSVRSRRPRPVRRTLDAKQVLRGTRKIVNRNACTRRPPPERPGMMPSANGRDVRDWTGALFRERGANSGVTTCPSVILKPRKRALAVAGAAAGKRPTRSTPSTALSSPPKRSPTKLTCPKTSRWASLRSKWRSRPASLSRNS